MLKPYQSKTTVYDKDGKPFELDGIDAREQIAAGLAFKNPPVVAIEVPADGSTAELTGDGTGEALPEIPADLPDVAVMTRDQMMGELMTRGAKFKATDNKYDLQQLVTAARAK